MDFSTEQKNLLDWKVKVEAMDIFMPESEDYTSYLFGENRSTYERFVSYIRDFSEMLIKGQGNIGITSMESECNTVARLNLPELPVDWWDAAIRVGKGKTVENNPIQPMESQSEEDKQAIYDALLPAYRAIKESFDKRWGFLSWIFNHDRYTAERDTLRALSGLMQSLTGETKRDLDRRLETYNEKVSFDRDYTRDIKDLVANARRDRQNSALQSDTLSVIGESEHSIDLERVNENASDLSVSDDEPTLRQPKTNSNERDRMSVDLTDGEKEVGIAEQYKNVPSKNISEIDLD